MTTLNCKHDSSTQVRAEKDYDGEIKFVATDEVRTFVVYADAGARAFARDILALVGEGEASEELKAGDYVEVTKDREWTSEDVGRRGRLVRIDARDTELPYCVKLDNDDDRGNIWFTEVRKAAEPDAPITTTTTAFPAHVEHAKQLLAGTAHTGADVITLARELRDATSND